MSSKQSGELTRLELQPSRLLFVVLSILHAIAAACVLLVLPYTHPAVLLSLPVILASAVFTTRRTALLCDAKSITAVTINADNKWLLLFSDGSESTARIRADSFVQPWLVVLNLITDRGVITVVMFPDALPGEQHRRLRSRLKTTRWFDDGQQQVRH